MKLFLPFLDIVLCVGLSDMIHDEALIVGLGFLFPQGGVPKSKAQGWAAFTCRAVSSYVNEPVSQSV